MGALDDMIARLRTLAETGLERAAEKAAKNMLRAVKETASAGMTPDGQPWEPTKTGRRALVHAADHVTAKALGTTAQLVLRGVDVFHNRGARGIMARRILPVRGAGIPKEMQREIADAVRETVSEILSEGP